MTLPPGDEHTFDWVQFIQESSSVRVCEQCLSELKVTLTSFFSLLVNCYWSARAAEFFFFFYSWSKILEPNLQQHDWRRNARPFLINSINLRVELNIHDQALGSCFMTTWGVLITLHHLVSLPLARLPFPVSFSTHFKGWRAVCGSCNNTILPTISHSHAKVSLSGEEVPGGWSRSQYWWQMPNFPTTVAPYQKATSSSPVNVQHCSHITGQCCGLTFITDFIYNNKNKTIKWKQKR